MVALILDLKQNFFRSFNDMMSRTLRSGYNDMFSRFGHFPVKATILNQKHGVAPLSTMTLRAMTLSIMTLTTIMTLSKMTN
jgi:hypothetical protein